MKLHHLIYLLLICVLPSVSAQTVLHTGERVSVTVSYTIGPNLFSVPIDTQIAIRDVFRSVQVCESGYCSQRIPVGTVLPGVGYVIWLGESETVTFTGRSFDKIRYDLQCCGTWICLGCPSYPVDIRKVDSRWIDKCNVWGWYDGWSYVWTLEPGKAYWIWLDCGKLNSPPTGAEEIYESFTVTAMPGAYILGQVPERLMDVENCMWMWPPYFFGYTDGWEKCDKNNFAWERWERWYTLAPATGWFSFFRP